MADLPDRVIEASDAYRENRESLLRQIAAHDEQLALVNGGGGPKYVARHRERGKMLIRERIEALLDTGSPFLELSPLAAYGSPFPVGAGTVSGIGYVEGVECMITGSDPTLRGGASNPFTLKKNLRTNEIIAENRLPTIALTESGGADLPTQSEIFVPGGRGFRDITNASAAGIPQISLVFGNSTAGGAYVGRRS
jgi:acyl-CoA carboxylase subunit beta